MLWFSVLWKSEAVGVCSDLNARNGRERNGLCWQTAPRCTFQGARAHGAGGLIVPGRGSHARSSTPGRPRPQRTLAFTALARSFPAPLLAEQQSLEVQAVTAQSCRGRSGHSPHGQLDLAPLAQPRCACRVGCRGRTILPALLPASGSSCGAESGTGATGDESPAGAPCESAVCNHPESCWVSFSCKMSAVMG